MAMFVCGTGAIVSVNRMGDVIDLTSILVERKVPGYRAVYLKV
jgi:hypothetical protein